LWQQQQDPIISTAQPFQFATIRGTLPCKLPEDLERDEKEKKSLKRKRPRRLESDNMIPNFLPAPQLSITLPHHNTTLPSTYISHIRDYQSPYQLDVPHSN
jgi:hypothetical protein